MCTQVDLSTITTSNLSTEEPTEPENMAQSERMLLDRLEEITELQTEPVSLISRFINSTIGVLAITGTLAIDKSQLLISATRVIQSSFRLGLLRSVDEEFHVLAKQHKIDLNYVHSQHYIQSFEELLRALENDDISPERLEFIKKIFLAGTMGAGEKNVLLTCKLMRIAGTLSVEEILLLQAIYKPDSVLGSDSGEQFVEEAIVELLTKVSGIPFQEDCLLAFNALSEKKLVGQMSTSNTSRGGLLTFQSGIRSSKGTSLYSYLLFYESKSKNSNNGV